MKIRACPFCTSTVVELQHPLSGYVHVGCNDCGATGPSFSGRRRHGPRGGVWATDAAVRAWNGEAADILSAVRDARR